MKVLLDTHAFIWWDSDPTKLSPQARAACEDQTNVVFLSVASAWEMQVKLQLGKLDLRLPLAEVIARQLLREALSICRRARPGLDGVTVHASPNAVGAYERLGFRAQAPEQTIAGIRFTPMRLQLGAKDAG